MVAAASAVGVYFVTQFSSLAVPDKIPALETAGRLISDLAPKLTLWSPFPNSVATLLEGAIPLAVGLALDARTMRGRVPLSTAALVMGFACALTMSRGAWLGLAVAAIAWVLVARAGRRAGPALAAFVLLAIPAMGMAMTWAAGLDALGRAAMLGGSTLARPDRIDIYKRSIALLGDVGLTGLGPGEQFAMAFSKFALLIQVPFVTYPHQLTFHVWLAYGIAGIVAWAWWLGASAVSVATAERERVSHTFRGAWCGLVAILVHGLSDARQAVDPWTWGPLFLLTALLASRQRRSGRVPSRISAMEMASVGVLVAATLALAVSRAWPVAAAWHTRTGIQYETTPPRDADEAAALGRLAVAEYERAIEIDPHNVGARRRLGLIAALEGDFATAHTHDSIALTSDADGYTTQKVAGLVATWSGRVDLGYALLDGKAGIADELRTWAFYWRQRDQIEAADHADRVASRLEGR